MATKSLLQPQPLVKPIHFFKIITLQSLHQGKLMVPNKFVENYGESLPNTVFLKTPNGAEWKLNLEKQNGKIWFEEGWREFAEYHSLAHGHLLVFRCQSASHFQVYILDLSALEIDYPSKRVEGEKASNNHGNRPPNDENLEYHRPSQKRKDNSAVDFLPLYHLRSRKSVKVENNETLTKEALHHNDTKCKEKSKATASKVTALDRANSFKSSNPFFLAVIHRSYQSHLTLPVKFWRRHFELHMEQRVIDLQVLNGSVWPAKFLINKHKTKTKVRLSWKAFVKNNNLKVGDVCTFELIPGTKLTLLVHIFRETHSSNCSTSQETSKATSNPFFLVVMRPSYVRWNGSYLSLPIEFSRKHIDLHNNQGYINLQELNGRVWPAKYAIMKNNKTKKATYRLESGWKAFVKYNNLKVGDVCTFELIDKTTLTFLVHIFRERDNSNCSTSQVSGQMRAACQGQREEMKTIDATTSSSSKS